MNRIDSDAPKECKYWIKCSVNCCPLDPDKRNRPTDILDKQQVCLVKVAEIRAKNLLQKPRQIARKQSKSLPLSALFSNIPI